MKVKVIFEQIDFDVLLAAKELASKMYLSAESESGAEKIAKSAVDSLADLIYFMARQDEGPSPCGECECAPCAGDCAECHCEECVEDEPETVTAEQVRAKVAEAIGCEPKSMEVVTSPTGKELLEALADIFGA